MRTKRYEVSDMKQAIERIKADLGSNAVILSTKRIKKPAAPGLSPKILFEVTAAVDDAAIPPKKPPLPDEPSLSEPNQLLAGLDRKTFYEGNTPRLPPKKTEDLSTPRADFREDEDISQILDELNSDIESSSAKDLPLFPTKDEERYIPVAKREETTLNIEETLKKMGFEELVKGVSDLKKEVAEIKRLMDDSISISVDLPQHLREYYTILTRNGLDDLVAYRFLKGVEKNLPELLGKAQMRNLVQNGLAEIIPIEKDFLSALSKKVVAFVGPTGVGKTTTIAKVAATLVLKYSGKVCLVTSDNFRIGAVDQLKTYADIVRLPLYVATSQKELSELLNSMSYDYDYILLDSTGRSPYDSTGVQDAIGLMTAMPTIMPVLVLSIAANHKELGDMYERYSGFLPEYIIFTKLDETKYFGPLASIAIKKKTPLLFLSTGQGVPDDMEIPDGKKIAKKILQELPTLWGDN
ncbi:MAG: flagellar biosynthesis protein FlhF [Deferribacteraceae bacterium]|jgi:flagellar biosynthesis protein FlhF|nr:flagellar biosynthesis protein FlhF [Deferribacteraceae bacterium]